MNGTQITGAALEESVDRVIGGPARKSRIISEQEKKVAAYHEAGHALAAWAMPDIEPVYKVTILPRGRTGGHALVVPEDDKELMTRSEMIARLVFAMGGRSAEELVFHEPTTGASSDIEQATKIARAMVTEYGMSAKLGAVKYGQEQGEPFLGRTAGRQADYSLEVAHEIDEEVRKLIEAAHTEAWDILNTHRDTLDALTAELIEHETLQRKDLERIFAAVTKRPRITAFNDFGERTPSDRPPIKTPAERARARRAVAAGGPARPRARARRLVPGWRQRRHPAGAERRDRSPCPPGWLPGRPRRSRPNRAVTPAHPVLTSRAPRSPTACPTAGGSAAAQLGAAELRRAARTGPGDHAVRASRAAAHGWAPPASRLAQQRGRARPHAGRRGTDTSSRPGLLVRRRTTGGRS